MFEGVSENSRRMGVWGGGGGGVIDPYYASLGANTIQVLLCGEDWLRAYYGIKRKEKRVISHTLYLIFNFNFLVFQLLIFIFIFGILVALYFRIKRTLKMLKYLSLEVDYAKVLSLCLCDHEF